MSKRLLVAVLGAGALVVVALAVLTPTVIVGADNHRVRVVAAGNLGMPAPTPVPTPRQLPMPRGRQGMPMLPRLQPFREFRGCLQQHGFRSGDPNGATAPDLRTLRDAMRACRETIPRPHATP